LIDAFGGESETLWITNTIEIRTLNRKKKKEMRMEKGRIEWKSKRKLFTGIGQHETKNNKK
jgi:hypothetical protein